MLKGPITNYCDMYLANSFAAPYFQTSHFSNKPIYDTCFPFSLRLANAALNPDPTEADDLFAAGYSTGAPFCFYFSVLFSCLFRRKFELYSRQQAHSRNGEMLDAFCCFIRQDCPTAQKKIARWTL